MKQKTSSGSVTAIAVMPNGTIVGVGTDKYPWSRATLTSSWVRVPNSGDVANVAIVPGSGGVKSVAAFKDGSIIGVGLDGGLVTWKNQAWSPVPGSGPLLSICTVR